MAEEDLIFGKNRHMFGGIEPSNMLEFSIVSKVGTIKLLARLPKDTIIDGQTLCTVAGAVIRRRADKSPVDEFDGDLVADIKTSNTITDSAADLNKAYYYAAFDNSVLSYRYARLLSQHFAYRRLCYVRIVGRKRIFFSRFRLDILKIG